MKIRKEILILPLLIIYSNIRELNISTNEVEIIQQMEFLILNRFFGGHWHK